VFTTNSVNSPAQCLLVVLVVDAVVDLAWENTHPKALADDPVQPIFSFSQGIEVVRTNDDALELSASGDSSVLSRPH
jgi:hypothetical protein